MVSAGNSVQITLPKNEVQLNAYVLPEPLAGKIILLYLYNVLTHMISTSLNSFTCCISPVRIGYGLCMHKYLCDMKGNIIKCLRS